MKRSVPYIHRVFLATIRRGPLIRRHGHSFNLLYHRTEKEISTIRGKTRFRKWMIAWMEKNPDHTLAFRLVGSPNRRRYHVIQLRHHGHRKSLIAGVMREVFMNGTRFGRLCYSHSPKRCRHRGRLQEYCSSSFR